MFNLLFAKSTFETFTFYFFEITNEMKQEIIFHNFIKRTFYGNSKFVCL